MQMEVQPILKISDLSVSFTMYEAGATQKELQVISNLSLTVFPGEILAVAGSSGSGKSLLASAILGILPGNAKVKGTMEYAGLPLTPERQAALRGTEIALVPQSVAFLDPLMKVGKQVDGHRKPRKTDRRRQIFKRLQLPQETEKEYPYQLSGGMARRVLVSTAMMQQARLVIADEPTPGMSLEQAKEALHMFREMADNGCAVILITHDIDLAFDFADRISVFYAGTTVETEPAENFRTGPQALCHPYSRALWNALPQNGFQPIPGFQPYAGNLPNGCLFSPRCPYATDRCRTEIPPMQRTGQGEVRCFYGTQG